MASLIARDRPGVRCPTPSRRIIVRSGRTGFHARSSVSPPIIASVYRDALAGKIALDYALQADSESADASDAESNAMQVLIRHGCGRTVCAPVVSGASAQPVASLTQLQVERELGLGAQCSSLPVSIPTTSLGSRYCEDGGIAMLHDAVRRNDAVAVASLLAAGVDVEGARVHAGWHWHDSS